jgi:3D (Asp-Asp-Asp) domain-containing protein
MAQQLLQFAERAGVLPLAGLAFALGLGAGAFFAGLQYADAAGDRLVFAAVGLDHIEVTARGADWAPPAPAAPSPQPAVAEVDVHTVARALSVQAPPRPRVSAPAAPAGTLASAYVTYYYCAGGGGDGGGFCGSTADGTPVQLGVAACDPSLMGQRFRVVGDPSGLIFRCADTGGAVWGGIRDMWFPTATAGSAWLNAVGHQVVVEVLE